MYRYFLKTVISISILIIPFSTFSQKEDARLCQKHSICTDTNILLDSVIKNFLTPIIKNDLKRFIVFYNTSGNTIIIFEDGNTLKESYLNLKADSLDHIVINSDFKNSFSGIFSSKKREYKVSKYNNGGNLCVLILYDGEEKENYCFNILGNVVPVKKKYYKVLVQKMMGSGRGW